MTPRAIPTPATSERDFQRTVTDLLRSLGWKHMHPRASRGQGGRGAGWVTATNVPGWPDLVCWHEGQERLLFAELKTDTGKLTGQQEALLASLRASGQEVHVWRPADFDSIVALLRGAPFPQRGDEG